MRLFRRITTSDDLKQRGLRGRATIESLELLQRGEFQLGAEMVEQMMAGQASMIWTRFRLRVEVPGQEPCGVKLKASVPTTSWARLGPGGSVAVLVDPDTPKRVEIDWGGEIVSPSLEQRVQDDPVLRALLERRPEAE